MRKWAGVLAAGLLCLAGAAEGQTAKDTITFRVADGYLLEATLGVPDAGEEAVPAVVLVHAEGGDRSEWKGLFDRLVQEGYVVLSYDIRGHGGSTALPEAYPREKLAEDPDMAPRDLMAAIRVVAGLDMVDGGRVALVGAGFGADLACAVSLKGEAKTLVALSPRAGAVHRLAGRDSVSLKSAYLVASEGDDEGTASVKALLHETAEPRRADILDGSNARGTGMLESQGDLANRILLWLRENL